MKKRKSSIIPLGDFEKVKEHDREEFKRKQFRKAVWCKRCGHKHGRREECELFLVEDLTQPSTKEDEDGKLIPNPKIGFYSTKKPKEIA